MIRYVAATSTKYRHRHDLVYTFVNHHHGIRRRDSVDSPTAPQRHKAGREDKSGKTSTGRRRIALFRFTARRENTRTSRSFLFVRHIFFIYTPKGIRRIKTDETLREIAYFILFSRETYFRRTVAKSRPAPPRCHPKHRRRRVNWLPAEESSPQDSKKVRVFTLTHTSVDCLY